MQSQGHTQQSNEDRVFTFEGETFLQANGNAVRLDCNGPSIVIERAKKNNDNLRREILRIKILKVPGRGKM